MFQVQVVFKMRNYSKLGQRATSTSANSIFSQKGQGRNIIRRSDYCHYTTPSVYFHQSPQFEPQYQLFTSL